ncbi:SKIP/SNW domain-containing protein [Lipomyces kononenkoae]|uniref:SKIP/SNW domain-containing protein n=1 Tax=Lipomyces kononenkoae TaxID=34357 RepID=A0ACC3T8Y7_LIPKO
MATTYNEIGAVITVSDARKVNNIPPYGQRTGWRPKALDDFGDGGAFPEINMMQYPLDMGRTKQGPSNALAIQVDAQGKIKYDAIARQGHAAGRIVHTSFSDLIPLRQRANIGEINLARPTEEEVADTTAKTKAAFELIVSGKSKAANAKSITNSKAQEPTYIRYTPSNMMGERGDTQHRQRIIKMVDLPEDPMEPPKFRHTKVPRGPPSPPAPLLRSPPRKLTAKDAEDFNIPPSVSKWKNPKGYTIALDKRLAADGRGLEEVKINDNFAKLSEALYAADRHAREEVKQRALLQQKIADQEKEAKEEHLRTLARKVREEREMGASNTRRRSASPRPVRTRSVSRGRSRSRSPSYDSRSPSYERNSRMSPSYERDSYGSRSYERRSYRSRSYERHSYRSNSYSRSRSRTPWSRTTRSRTPQSRTPSPSRPYSRSPSRSYSRSPSRSYSRSPSRSYSRSPSRSMSRSPSRTPRSRSRSYSR